MNIIVVDPPEIEPVTLEEARQWLRLDAYGSPPEHPDDDEVVALIIAAREKVEQITRRSFIHRRLRMVTDAYPVHGLWAAGSCGCWCYDNRCRAAYVELLHSPVVSLESVAYTDSDGNDVAIELSSYRVDKDFMPARLYVQRMPSYDPLKIEYIAGYAETGSPGDQGVAKTPQAVKLAIKYLVQLHYDEHTPAERDRLETAVTSILESLVVHTF